MPVGSLVQNIDVDRQSVEGMSSDPLVDADWAVLGVAVKGSDGRSGRNLTVHMLELQKAFKDVVA
jgi:hypothetical protein